MATSNRKSCQRIDSPGDAHFLTFSCFKRLPLLSRNRSRQWMVDAIDRAREKSPFELWAWVVMPEHVHLVLYPCENARISSILTTLKQSVSKRALNWLRTNRPDYLDHLQDLQPNGKSSHRFWQRGGGYDRNLRSVRDIHEKIRYVHFNPVSRGLVNEPTDWKWSSAGAWLWNDDSVLKIDRESVPALTIMDDRVDSDLMR